ncbi:TPA: 3D domain-containing protein [Candidatus Gracilibacteria bacterium]|nr:3D domain-containing protein [Candidatus Gracilibacteria bacterium]HIQ57297.1 3D domain-containing protein [Candidatus Gracilibacteria bacterium]
MKFYSYLVSSVSVLFLLFCAGFVSAQTFQISAYYSPVPNQNAYVSGSYAADLRMNGNGTHGADGTAVYVGMISAPSKYSYGTKIFIPGLGIGTVHDRGGAIYSAKGYDRLDIWMGYGDAGRKRALQWGRQMVEGEIILSDVTEGFIFTDNVSENFGVNLWFKMNTFGNISAEILKIQDFLHCEQTGKYDYQTSKAVYVFQVNQNILKYKNEKGAGTWGPKTRLAAQKVLKEMKKEEGIEKVEKWVNGVDVSTFEAVRK